MTKNQVNQVNMLQTTLLILTSPTNAPITAGLPAFMRGQSALEGSLNVLSALTQAQGSPITGIAMDKNRLKQSLISRALVVAGAAGAYAHEASNHTQAALFQTTESSLRNMRDSLLDDTAQNLHDRAAELVAADPAKAAEYNLTPMSLTALQSAITAYGSTLGTPRAAIATRVATTEAIAAEIDRAIDNLKKVIDRLIVQFDSTHPAFTAAYAAARKIVNSGNTHAATAAAAAPPQA
jgi:hypothetical protein